MKRAVIATGGKQYLVAEDEVLDIEVVDTDKKTISFDVLLIMDEKTTKVGTPHVEGAKVDAQIIESEFKGDKVTAIRYKAKKRVKKVHGHRQHHTKIKITKIA